MTSRSDCRKDDRRGFKGKLSSAETQEGHCLIWLCPYLRTVNWVYNEMVRR